MTDLLARAPSPVPSVSVAADPRAAAAPATDPLPWLETVAGRAPRGYRRDVAGLRAVAIVLIVIAYARTGTSGPSGSGSPLALAGVDLGLVVAGYLCVRGLLAAADALDGSAVGRLRALRRRWAAAIRHAAVATSTTVVAVLVAACVWAAPRAVLDTGLRVALHPGDLGRTGARGPQPLQHLWALGLGVELGVMLVVPVGIIVALTPADDLRRLLRGPLLALVLSTAAAYSYLWRSHAAGSAVYAPLAHVWAVALGGLIATAAYLLADLPRFAAEFAAFGGLAVLIGGAVLVGRTGMTATSGLDETVPALAAAIMVAAGTGAPRRIERLLGESMLQCVGRLAGYWYLWLWPLQVMAPIVTHAALDWQRQLVLGWISVVVAIVTHQVAANADRGPRPVGRSLAIGAAWIAFAVLIAAAVAASPNGGCAC